MAGLDNITAEILAEAKAETDASIAEANRKAAELIAQAQKTGGEIRAKSDAKADSDAASYAKRIESQAEMRKRQAVLRTKQDIIGEVIDAAYEKLASLPDDRYFAMLGTLLRKHVQNSRGELLLGKKDLGRMPDSFAKEAEDAAQSVGGSLHVCEEPADIENGFVLRYGGIEENCTLKALFSEKQDLLRDKVQALLW